MPDKVHQCSTSATYKDVVVIGNGPSAITLSYLLSGHVPYYRGNSSDEFLHLRLSENSDEPLVLQDLEFLSDGLEGRSTNPVSVLFDALAHPDADLGVQQPSLLEWKLRKDLSVNHVVLGPGCPGGAWKTMTDSELLTVSLGTWMELPNLSMKDWRPDVAKAVGGRVSVSTVAAYYREYVQLMSMGANFDEDTLVTNVRKVSNDRELCTPRRGNTPDYSRTLSLPNEIAEEKKSPVGSNEDNAVFEQEFLYRESSFCQDIDEDMEFSSCNGATSSSNCSEVTSASYDEASSREDIISDNCLSATRIGQVMRSQARRRANTTCCLDMVSKCPHNHNTEEMRYDLFWNPIVFDQGSFQNTGLACSFGGCYGRSYTWGASRTPRSSFQANRCPRHDDDTELWEVIGLKTLPNGQQSHFKYLTKNIVLATGSYDKANDLEKPGENLDFVVHSLKAMEEKLVNEQNGIQQPVVIVGAGLSAADAIVAALNKGYSVIHVFRRSPEDPRLIFNNLPAAIYPEYHQIHRMMAQKESHPGYKPYAQHHVVKIDPNKKVTLHGSNSKSGSMIESVQASLVVVLIGASPNLDFLEEQGCNLGVVLDKPISRNNLVDIDLFSHESVRQNGIYAMGPLVGDNFVRFLQGGALAITNHILKKKHREKLQ